MRKNFKDAPHLKDNLTSRQKVCTQDDALALKLSANQMRLPNIRSLCSYVVLTRTHTRARERSCRRMSQFGWCTFKRVDIHLCSTRMKVMIGFSFYRHALFSSHKEQHVPVLHILNAFMADWNLY